MGCDIHSYVEVCRDGDWTEREESLGEAPFKARSYGMFGFLADVRNYSQVPTICEPRGIPSDTSESVRDQYEDWEPNAHSASYVTLQELLDYDYSKVFWDLRVTKQVAPNHFDCAATAEEGEGQHLTIKEFLGEWFFRDLSKLQETATALALSPDQVRVVFWFDN